MKRIFLTWIWTIGLLLISNTLMADTYEKGLEAYKDGSYSKAYKLLGKAVKKSKSKTQQAKSMALMGAAAAKMGKKGKGKSLMAKAAKLDGNVELPSVAMKDKTVKQMFAKASGSGGMSDDEGGSRSSRSRRSKASPGGFSLTSVLPFGINQFMQGKTLLGGAFGGAQAAGIFLFLDRTNAAKKADEDAAAVIAEAEAANGTNDQAFLDFLDQNEAFVQQSKSEANLGLALAAGAYGLSVIEAIFDPFGLSKSMASVDPDPVIDEAWAQVDIHKTAPVEAGWRLDLKFVPSEIPSVFVAFKTRF